VADHGMHGMKVERDIALTMRAGVRISLCVYRRPFSRPVLRVAYQYQMGEAPAYLLFLWRETGPIEWYVGKGWAYVHADVRGSGRSEGECSQRPNLSLRAEARPEPEISQG